MKCGDVRTKFLSMFFDILKYKRHFKNRKHRENTPPKIKLVFETIYFFYFSRIHNVLIGFVSRAPIIFVPSN